MSDTWTGSSSTAWFTAGNWSTGAVPTISATGTQSVVINGSLTNQPVIPYSQNIITVIETVITAGTTYTSLVETQIGGEQITLTNGANLTIQGDALGVFYGNTDTITATGGTMTGLHGVLSTTPSYDSHMQLVAIGNDTLTVQTINENFGLITIGSGDTLTIDNITGSNPQALHGLINYGLITVASGGHLNINATSASGSTISNFYNSGWIVVDGGTLSISSAVLDNAPATGTSGAVDGYIEIGGSGDVILASTVASSEQITFTDTTANTLQITAGTLFSGTVNNFGPTDTIVVNGFTSTSNATLTTVGGVTELITANGSVMTTITLTGSLTTNITTGTNASGQEYIISGGNTVASSPTYAGGTQTLASTNGGTLLNNGTVVVTGAGTDLVVTSSLTGTGGFFIDNGATLSLDNTAGNDAGQKVTFGTHGSASAPNTLLINGNSAGFSGTVIGFGAGDQIILGASVLTEPTTGSGALLSYSAGVLTVEDTNSSTGSIISSTQISIGGTAALSTASFVELNGSGGTDIYLYDNQGFNFSLTSGTTGAFETGANFTGGTAPGDMLLPGETVTIASGTASVSSTGVADNAFITVASGATFLDNGSLSGAGTLNVGAGGFASLNGATSLSSITDAGTLFVSGTESSAIALTSSASKIVLNNGGDITGNITGGTGTITIGTGAGTLLGGATVGLISDTSTLVAGGTFSAPITLTATGSQLTIASNFADSGLVRGFGGGGAGAPRGTITVNSGVTASFTGGVTAGSALVFGTLVTGASTNLTSINLEGNSKNTVADFTGADVTNHTLNTAITNLGYADKIILGSSDFALNGTSDVLTSSYNAGILTVTDSTNGSTVTLAAGLASGDSSSLIQVSATPSGLVITLCFYPGTALASPEGEIKVEDIRAGDMLTTKNGAMPVRWIGQSHIHTRFADPLRALPIRIRAGALGNNLPVRDLLLSPDHAIHMDGILVQAGALVNGTSIVREHDVPEQFTYYHVELASHELLLAEGVEAESFVDNVARMHFQNWDERNATAEPIVEMALPRAKSARQVPASIRRRLGGTAAAVA